MCKEPEASGAIPAAFQLLSHFDVDLAVLEKRVARIQKELLRHDGDVDNIIEHGAIKAYAEELAERYYPLRHDNDCYIAPVIYAFQCDLVLAPKHHLQCHLWRYNYDDLDVLAPFYKFSTPSKGYYHVAQGRLGCPTKALFERGCDLLRVRLSGVDELFATYNVEGARARVAARVIETIAGLPDDCELNRHYGFMESDSAKNMRVKTGLGKFRFLRRGRTWMALGTRPAEGTIDIRRRPVDDVFGYRVQVKNGDIKASVGPGVIQQAEADMAALLESGSSLPWRIKQVSEFYSRFYQDHRFANSTNWCALDHWLTGKLKKLQRAEPKRTYQLFLAAKERPPRPFLPHRTNFFWRIEEINCPYSSIWNPYKWPQPEPYHLRLAASKMTPADLHAEPSGYVLLS